MIGRLSGTVAAIERDALVLDVHGVGYEVHMTTRDLGALAPGDALTVIVETIVREDLIRLYGFRDAAHREWFRLLQTLQAVGAKVALGILSTLPPDQLAQAIAADDRAAIARAPGVGKRVAERVVTELRGKMPAAAISVAPAAAPRPADEPLADAISALVNLGYAEADARAALAAIRADAPDAGAATLIRAGLKALAA
jgi:Holliday junction DNA helicase RuvA